jgi:hypothetical protein
MHSVLSVMRTFRGEGKAITNKCKATHSNICFLALRSHRSHWCCHVVKLLFRLPKDPPLVPSLESCSRTTVSLAWKGAACQQHHNSTVASRAQRLHSTAIAVAFSSSDLDKPYRAGLLDLPRPPPSTRSSSVWTRIVFIDFAHAEGQGQVWTDQQAHSSW